MSLLENKKSTSGTNARFKKQNQNEITDTGAVVKHLVMLLFCL
jgi:hypothetical protein